MSDKISRPVHGQRNVQRVLAYKIMSDNLFSYVKRMEWVWWAAHHHACVKCEAAWGEHCFNLSDLNYIRKHPETTRPQRRNRTPHDERVDWGRLLEGLRYRGYQSKHG